KKIAAAMRPSRTPSNGLETANQNETFQPDSLVIELVFTLLSQAFEDRHFRNLEIFSRERPLARDAPRSLRDQYYTRDFADWLVLTWTQSALMRRRFSRTADRRAAGPKRSTV